MNRTTALLLSLFLITGSALAQDEGSQTFSVDALTFNLDWNDTQFDWSQSNCFDLGSGDAAAADLLSTGRVVDAHLRVGEPGRVEAARQVERD